MFDKYIYNTLHFIMKWAGKLNSWAWREHVKRLRSDRWKKIKKKLNKVNTFNWGPCVLRFKIQDDFRKVLLDEAKTRNLILVTD